MSDHPDLSNFHRASATTGRPSANGCARAISDIEKKVSPELLTRGRGSGFLEIRTKDEHKVIPFARRRIVRRAISFIEFAMRIIGLDISRLLASALLRERQAGAAASI
jgi:hypothetical protein